MEIVERAVDVAVVGDHESVRTNRDGDLADPSDELVKLRAGGGKGLRPTVHNDELVPVGITCNAAAKEPSVVGLVVNDVLESLGDVAAVRSLGIVKAAIREDPKDEVRVAMGKLLDRGTASSKPRRKKREAFSGLSPVDRA